MIRLLQKKFIRTAMLAVTVVMLVFLAAINVLNDYTMRRDGTKTLQLILAGYAQEAGNEPGGPGAVKKPDGPAGARKEPGAASAAPGEGAADSVPEKPAEEVTQEALAFEQFFFVHFAEDGRVVDTDTSHTMALEETEAQALAAQAWSKGEAEGRIGTYRFRRMEDRAGGGSRYVFLDTRQQQRAVFRTLLVTLIVGAVTWVLMLLLVMAMSRRAILPIAQNMERQKQFVTDAGHEIKTPLAIIQANADVLELHLGANKWIDNIRSQITRLGSLTQNLLILSRMEEGEAASVPAVRFDAGEILLETLQPFREGAELRSVDLLEHIEEGVMLTWQKDAYIRLLGILFENAVKYVREGGFIEISLRREGREVVIEEKNDTEAELTDDPDRLFDRFYRADKARTQKTGGSGIGLSVARAIAEQGGGSIRASYADSHTILFTLRIPKAGP